MEPLVAALGSWNMLARAGAGRALGQIGDPRAVEPLIAALGIVEWHAQEVGTRSPDRGGQGTRGCERSSGQTGERSPWSPWWQLAGSDDGNTRRAAAAALETRRDTRPWVRSSGLL